MDHTSLGYKGPDNQLIYDKKRKEKLFACEEKMEIGQQEDMKVNHDQNEGEKIQEN